MPVKIADVAGLAGVSTATVSRVLSGKPHVSDSARERVMAAVDELGYRPSRVVVQPTTVQPSRVIPTVTPPSAPVPLPSIHTATGLAPVSQSITVAKADVSVTASSPTVTSGG